MANTINESGENVPYRALNSGEETSATSSSSSSSNSPVSTPPTTAASVITSTTTTTNVNNNDANAALTTPPGQPLQTITSNNTTAKTLVDATLTSTSSTSTTHSLENLTEQTRKGISKNALSTLNGMYSELVTRREIKSDFILNNLSEEIKNKEPKELRKNKLAQKEKQYKSLQKCLTKEDKKLWRENKMEMRKARYSFDDVSKKLDKDLAGRNKRTQYEWNETREKVEDLKPNELVDVEIIANTAEGLIARRSHSSHSSHKGKIHSCN